MCRLKAKQCQGMLMCSTANTTTSMSLRINWGTVLMYM